MTWAMLQELDKTGQVEFGAHTLSHLDLSAASAEKSSAEIVGSKSILNQGLGHPISAFCYPSGKYNANVVAQVKKAGYLTATTVEYGVKQNFQNPYTMPRVRVNGPRQPRDLDWQAAVGRVAGCRLGLVKVSAAWQRVRLPRICAATCNL